MNRVILLLVFVLLFSEPLVAKTFRVGARPDPLIVESKNLGGKTYHMLGSISVSGFSRKEVLQKLKDKARESNADAVIGVNFSKSEGVMMSMPFRNPNRQGVKPNAVYPMIAQITAEGLLVRFSSSVSKAPQNQIVPVLD